MSDDSSSSEESDDLTSVTRDTSIEDPKTHLACPVEVWERILLLVRESDMKRVVCISKQLRGIVLQPSFQARYFLYWHQKCEAIFEASQYWRLFTPELLETLMLKGAILSRDFVQVLCEKYYSHSTQVHRISPYYAHSTWPAQITFQTFLAVLQNGYEQYGNTISQMGQRADHDAIQEWAESDWYMAEDEDEDDDFNTMSGEKYAEHVIDEVFVKSRFALFDKGDISRREVLQRTVAIFPELVKILHDNGFEFGAKDRAAIFNHILTGCFDISHMPPTAGITTEEEFLYQLVDKVLVACPEWKTSASHCSNVFGLNDFDVVELLPYTEETYRYLLRKDGLGPVPTALKVAKRLYLEGKLFPDLHYCAAQYVQDCLDEDNTYAISKARILYQYFPEALQDLREKMATACVSEYQKTAQLSNIDPTGKDLMRQCLFATLIEMSLGPVQLARSFSDDTTSRSLVVPAIKAGLFGTDWTDHLDGMVQALIDPLIDEPMKGTRLREVESIVQQCYKLRGGHSVTPESFLYEHFDVQLRNILMSWAFDLGRLVPDPEKAYTSRFKTFIGWMVEGTVPVKNVDKGCECVYLRFLDPYHLVPRYPHYRGAHMVDLKFYTTKDEEMLPLLFQGMEASDPADEETALRESNNNIEATEIVIKQGWKHMGHLDPITGQLDPSQASNEMVKADHEMATKASLPSTSTKTSDDKAGSVKIGEKKESYSSSSASVYGIVCRSTSKCKQHVTKDASGAKQKGPEEMADVIVEYLGADSPAVRDVLLAHALVNGNVELLCRLMIGEYGQVAEAKESNNSLKGRAAEKKKSSAPVLPTLAHLRILQKLDRPPLDWFTDCILHGAPFKRGHVKDSSVVASEECMTLDERHAWYVKAGHSDDQSMTATMIKEARWEEKSSQALTDVVSMMSKPIHQEGTDIDHLMRSRLNSNEESTLLHTSEEGIVDMDLKDTKENVDSEMTKSMPFGSSNILSFKFDGSEYEMSLTELHRRQASLSLWKQHLLLLQGLGGLEEEARLVKPAKGEPSVNNKDQKLKHQSQFVQGLDEMIEKVMAMEKELEKQRLALQVDDRLNAMAVHKVDDEVVGSKSDGKEMTLHGDGLKRKRESPIKQMLITKYCKREE